MKAKSFLKQNAIISIGIIFSRITGFIRDIFFANVLGVGDLPDAFFAAFKLPNIFRRIFADGGLITAFVPVFTKSISYSRRSALILAGQVFSILLLIVTIFTIVLFIFMPIFIKLTNPGFVKDYQKLLITIQAARICIFFLILSSTAALLAGMLNSVAAFSYHAFSTVLFNSGLVVCGVFLIKHIKYIEPIYLLSISLLAGGLLGLGLNFIGIKRNNLTFYPQRLSLNAKVKKVLYGIMHSFASSGMINVFVNMIFASLFTGVTSYIYYIDRIINLPISIIGYTLGASILRAISVAFVRCDKNELNKTHKMGITIASALSIPCLFAFVYYGDVILHFIYSGAKFQPKDFENLFNILKISAYSMPFIVVNRIFLSSFFATNLSFIQFRIGIFIIILNIILTILLLEKFQIFAMSIAFSVSSIVGFFLNIFFLRWYKIYNAVNFYNLICIFCVTSIAILSLILNSKLITALSILSISVLRIISFGIIYLSILGIFFAIQFIYSKKCSQS